MDDFQYREPDPNKRPAADVWNERYGSSGYLFGKEPCLLVRHHADALRKGKALDVAMGEGRNAVFLAKQGFVVEGVDCSSAAVEKAKRLAEEQGVTVDAKTQNLDFFLMPLMKYDTVVMTYFKPLPRFYSEIKRGLVAGGTVAIEAYLVEQARKHPNPTLDADQCFRPNELLHALKDFEVLYYSELPQGPQHVVQALARKTR
jgi:2-polyprenyl-3-methyl-5-hydroxy-6-metoxy-1,4-benzoquinol methylase